MCPPVHPAQRGVLSGRSAFEEQLAGCPWRGLAQLVLDEETMAISQKTPGSLTRQTPHISSHFTDRESEAPLACSEGPQYRVRSLG